MAKAKRGRPPKPPAARKRNNLTIRVRDKLKADLEAQAADNQRSLSEEAETRLERSFSQKDVFEQVIGGRDIRAQTEMMMVAFRHEGEAMAHALGHPKWSAAEWMRDAQCYRAAVWGVLKALMVAQPGAGWNEDKVALEFVFLKSRFITWLTQAGLLSGQRSGFEEESSNG